MGAVTGLMAVVVCAMAQLSLPGFQFMTHARPPLLLGFVIYCGLNRSRAACLTFAFLAGFLNDALSITPLGLSALIFMALGAATLQARETVQIDSAVTHAVLGCAASFLATLATEAVLLAHGMLPVGMEWLWLRLFWAGMLGLFWTPIVFMTLTPLERSVGILESEDPT